jgi:hypothetical protein
VTLYHYGDDSVIQKISLGKSAGGGARAFIYAGEAATDEQASAIKDLLNTHGWHCVATEKDGEYCLELRGVKDIEPLENALRARGFLAGKQAHASADGKRISTGERIRNNMLLVSGGLNMLADVGYIRYGVLKSKLRDHEKDNWQETAAGGAYMAGSTALTLFGHGDKSDHHINELCIKLRDKFLLDGLEIPERCAIRSFTTEQPGVLNHLKQFMEKHPSELGNGSYAVAGGLIALGAHNNTGDKSTKVTESILGLTTVVSGLTPVVVKEQAPDPNRPEPKTPIGKAIRWVQERPNRVAGYGYMVSTAAHAVETVRKLWEATSEKDPKEKMLTYEAYGMRGVFIVFNLISEVIMTLSSKGHGSGVKTDKSLDETAYAITADAIAHQAPGAREKLIVDLSQFLAHKDVLGGKEGEIETVLRSRVAKLSRNPWSPLYGASAATDTPSVREERAETAENSKWTNKAIAHAAQKELSLSQAL